MMPILIFYSSIGWNFLFAIENNGRGVKAIGMASAFVAVSDNFWAMEYNPAGLARIDKYGFSFFVVPEQFGLSELRTYAGVMTIPLSYIKSAFKMERFGFEYFHETVLGIALAGSIDHNVFIGLGINVNQLQIHNYGTTNYYSLDGGLLVEVLDNINFGCAINNFYQSRKVNLLGQSPLLIAIGLCWIPILNTQLSLEMEKDIRFPISLKVGIEQKIMDVLSLRLGVADNPSKYAAGLGIKYMIFEFGYAGYSHIDLGWTHQIELAIILD